MLGLFLSFLNLSMTKKYRIHIMGKKFQSIGKMTFSRNFFLYQDFEFWQVAKFISKYKKITNQMEKYFVNKTINSFTAV